MLRQARLLPPITGAFQIFAFTKTELLEFSTSASVRPHKKAVKKIETEGAKEKQLLPKLGSEY
jgi:hypothetical protein